MERMNPGPPQGSPFPFRLQAILKPALLVALFATLALAALVNLDPRTTDADPSFDSEEQAFFALINEYRLQNGHAPLITDCRLNAAADWFANDMAIDNYWPVNHRDNENPPRGPSERVAAFGFDAPVGENIAGGFTTAAVVFQAWVNSPGHDSNMLSDNYVAIGIGRAYSPTAQFGWYWVADFAVYVPPPAQPQCAPSATPLPSPQPTTKPLVWGDTDCDSQIGPLDSLRVLRLNAGLSTATEATCMAMGGLLIVNGTLQLWGDVNCNGLDPVDAILILRFGAGLPVQTPADCPSLGELV